MWYEVSESMTHTEIEDKRRWENLHVSAKATFVGFKDVAS